MSVRKADSVRLGSPVDDRDVRFNIVDVDEGAADVLDRDYEVFRIRCKGYANRNVLSSALLSTGWVLAVRNTQFGEDDSSSVYVLCRREEGRRADIESLVEDTGSEDIAKPVCESFSCIPPEVALQLLVNSFHHRRADRVNNVFGRCLQVHGFEDYRDGSKGRHKEVVCLEYLFRRLPSIVTSGAKDVFLTCRVVTLTNVRECRYMDFPRGKSERDYPHYVCDRYGIRTADSSTDMDEEQYIERTTRYHTKNTVTFFHSGSKDALSGSKSYMMNAMIKRMNDFFPGIGVHFRSVSTSVFEPSGTTSYAYHNDRARSLVEGCKVSFVNIAGDAYADVFDDFVKRVGISRRVTLEVFTEDVPSVAFVLIHERGYYDERGLEDDYGKGVGADVVQHVTVEGINEMLADCRADGDRDTAWKMFVENNVENAAVKLENHRRRMLLTGWPLRNVSGKVLGGDYSFAMRARDLESDAEGEDDPVFVYSVFHADGTFDEIRIMDEDDDDTYDLYRALNASLSDTEFVVRDGNGNINIVRSTDILTVPDTSLMEGKLQYNKDHGLNQDGIASREGRASLYPECVDIGYRKVSEKEMYYFVGMVGPGVKKKFQNAVNVRKVVAFGGSELFFEDLIPTLAVPYVRHNQCTVHPFPCKNLSEYIGFNHLC